MLEKLAQCSKNKIKENKNTLNKFYRAGEKFYFLNHHLGKATWIEGFTEKRIDEIMFVMIKLVTVVEGELKAPFSIGTTRMCRGGHYSFPRIASLYP